MRTQTRVRTSPRHPVTPPPLSEDLFADDEPENDAGAAYAPEEGSETLVFRPRRGAPRRRQAPAEAARAVEPAPATAPEPVMSPIWPLLWMAVPLVLVILWAVIEQHLAG